ncbi:hypothetical protein AX17_001488 [Amanita inopinata Kibby_2008]|nr:hypothetical protein AX17_001488 [Amanita inopinata Kibby_2008]
MPSGRRIKGGAAVPAFAVDVNTESLDKLTAGSTMNDQVPLAPNELNDECTHQGEDVGTSEHSLKTPPPTPGTEEQPTLTSPSVYFDFAAYEKDHCIEKGAEQSDDPAHRDAKNNVILNQANIACQKEDIKASSGAQNDSGNHNQDVVNPPTSGTLSTQEPCTICPSDIVHQLQSGRRTQSESESTAVFHTRESRNALFAALSTPPTVYPRPETARSFDNWVTHNTPLLQQYAARQISPPLGRRVDVQLNDPSQFVSGTLQALANRLPGNEQPDHSRQLHLLDNFVDIDRWARVYLMHELQGRIAGNLVPVLMTIIADNMYEAFARLIDSIVRRAIRNMNERRGTTLEIEDFAFGFDLHVNQDLPFFVEANHRTRDTMERFRGALAPPITQTSNVVGSDKRRGGRQGKRSEANSQIRDAQSGQQKGRGGNAPTMRSLMTEHVRKSGKAPDAVDDPAQPADLGKNVNNSSKSSGSTRGQRASTASKPSPAVTSVLKEKMETTKMSKKRPNAVTCTKSVTAVPRQGPLTRSAMKRQLDQRKEEDANSGDAHESTPEGLCKKVQSPSSSLTPLTGTPTSSPEGSLEAKERDATQDSVCNPGLGKPTMSLPCPSAVAATFKAIEKKGGDGNDANTDRPGRSMDRSTMSATDGPPRAHIVAEASLASVLEHFPSAPFSMSLSQLPHFSRFVSQREQRQRAWQEQQHTAPPHLHDAMSQVLSSQNAGQEQVPSPRCENGGGENATRAEAATASEGASLAHLQTALVGTEDERRDGVAQPHTLPQSEHSAAFSAGGADQGPFEFVYEFQTLPPVGPGNNLESRNEASRVDHQSTSVPGNALGRGAAQAPVATTNHGSAARSVENPNLICTGSTERAGTVGEEHENGEVTERCHKRRRIGD